MRSFFVHSLSVGSSSAGKYSPSLWSRGGTTSSGCQLPAINYRGKRVLVRHPSAGSTPAGTTKFKTPRRKIMLTRYVKPYPKLTLNGCDNAKILRLLMFTVNALDERYPKKFLTHHMICREYQWHFSHQKIPSWYLRGFLKQPNFTLDDELGWRCSVRIYNAPKT